MGLIKASQAPTKVSAFTLTDVEAHAAQIIADAKDKAARLIVAAETEAERIRQQRYQQGFAEGQKAGLAQGIEAGRKSGHDEALARHGGKFESLVHALTDASTKLDASRRKLESETVHDVIRLAVAIARRVTKALGQTDPSVIKANVAEALRTVVNASAVKVVLHPSQMAVLEEELPAIRSMFPKLQQVELVADEMLSPGGCRLQVGSGMVDADLDAQLDRIIEELLPPGAGAPV